MFVPMVGRPVMGLRSGGIFDCDPFERVHGFMRQMQEEMRESMMGAFGRHMVPWNGAMAGPFGAHDVGNDEPVQGTLVYHKRVSARGNPRLGVSEVQASEYDRRAGKETLQLQRQIGDQCVDIKKVRDVHTGVETTTRTNCNVRETEEDEFDARWSAMNSGDAFHARRLDSGHPFGEPRHTRLPRRRQLAPPRNAAGQLLLQ
eukprot:Sspe_Gene.60682::Locus_33499_Transcript_2_4_Confidence_0.286_Length_870::g.60682::m.60682